MLLSIKPAYSNQLVVGTNATFRSIHAALRSAIEGDTILVNQGVYREGNIMIKMPLTLIGKGIVVVDGQDKDEVFTIMSDKVTIRHFTVRNCGSVSIKDLAGIKVLASDDCVIDGNTVENCSFGIYLSNTRRCRVLNNLVKGEASSDPSVGNGIHVWKCDSAFIGNNESTGQRDGIYFEFVTNTTIEKNYSHNNIRYGLHFMFSHSNGYTWNRFANNGAGVAVMYSHNVKMHHNIFEHNWGSSSYGILLKDITDSEVEDNVFESNSAGIYMEGSNRIKVERNSFLNNGWALRVQASCTDNTISHNNFSGNTFDVSTNGETQLNSFLNNYWDKYEGYDLNRDGYGDIPYRPVSLFSMIVEQLPPGILLLRSFMVYLLDKAEKIIPSLTPTNLIDDKPVIRMIDFKEKEIAIVTKY